MSDSEPEKISLTPDAFAASEAALDRLREAVGRTGDPDLSQAFAEFTAAKAALAEATHARLGELRERARGRAGVSGHVN
jgi:hypothetical protein